MGTGWERPSIGVGISPDCAIQGHGQCTDDGCRCRCHMTARELNSVRVTIPAEIVHTPPSQVTQGNARCPNCGTAGKNGDKFCRKDGSKLQVPHCRECGQFTESGDEFCGGCGAALLVPVGTVDTEADR